MLRFAYTAIKYLAIGLLIGLLTAPRSGVESRRLLKERGLSAAKDLLASLGNAGRRRPT